MVYCIALVLILIGIYTYDYQNTKRNKLLLWIILCIFLICIAGFRYRLGADTIMYTRYYETIPNIFDLRGKTFEHTRFAPGFIVLMSLCKTFSDDVVLLLIVESLIVNISVFYLFWQNSKHCYFALLLYFIFLYTDLNMEVLREAIAVSIFLWAWPFFKNGKWLPYYIMTLFSTLFHISAIMTLLLPVICIPGIKEIFKFGKRTIIFSLIIFFIGIFISQYFIKYIELLSLSENVMERADAYSKDSMGGSNNLNIVGVIQKLTVYVGYVSIAMYFLNKQSNPYRLHNMAIIKTEMLAICSIYVSIFSIFVFIVARYNNYLLFFSLIIISDWIFTPLSINRRKVKLQPAIWILLFIPFFTLATYSLYYNNFNKAGTLKSYMKYVPYNSVFDKEKDADREKTFKYKRR